MKLTGTRVLAIAAVVSTMAVAAPVSTAGADTIIGPTYITTAPSTFINNNNQVSPGSNTSGGQFVA